MSDTKWEYGKVADKYVFTIEGVNIDIAVSSDDLQSALIDYNEYRYPTFIIDKEGFSGKVQIPYEVLKDALEDELEEGYKEQEKED